MSDEKIEITKVPLSVVSKASKSGSLYYFRIPPDNILTKRIIHGKWYKLFLKELSDEETKNLGLR